MKNLIILFFSTFLFIGCSRNNDTETDNSPKLPSETQTGANTFGCYINGNLLIPRDGTGDFSGLDKGAMFWGDPTGNQQYNELEIKDYKSEHTAKILIHIHNLHQIGVSNYIVDESNGLSDIDGFQHTYIHCRIFNPISNSYQYYRSYENSGIIKITRYDSPNINISNRIVSGIFSGKLKNSTNPNDIIDLSQGRFDINKSTLPNKVFP